MLTWDTHGFSKMMPQYTQQNLYAFGECNISSLSHLTILVTFTTSSFAWSVSACDFWGYPHKFCSLNDLKEAIRIEAAVTGRDMLVMDNFEEQFLMCLQKDKCHFLEVFFFCRWKIFVFNILNYMFLKWHELQNVFM